MATKKVTVTLPVDQVDEIKALVVAGHAPNVSAFVAHAVGVALDDVVGWADMLASSLAENGGELTDAERAWADSVLDDPAPDHEPAA